jgi:hypothetical protein
MNEPIYVFQCPNCDSFNDSGTLNCESCGELVNRAWTEVITDGAPTGAQDPEFVRGFRRGQEWTIEMNKNTPYTEGFYNGMEWERNRIIKDLLADAVISTNVTVDLLERIVKIVEKS